MTRVITFGTFDVLHIGHLNILERARELGDHLTVGVSSDALNWTKKNRQVVFPEAQRMRIIASLKCVDSVFCEQSLDEKPKYIEMHQADILVMGDDWRGEFDDMRTLCEVVYLPRTPSVSTTETIEKIRA